METLIVWEIAPGVTFSGNKSIRNHCGPIEHRKVTDKALRDNPELIKFVKGLRNNCHTNKNVL